MPQYVFKYGEILRIRIFTGQKGNNEDSLFPLGVEPELVSQVPPILFQDMEGSDLALTLGKIGNSRTSSFSCIIDRSLINVHPEVADFRMKLWTFRKASSAPGLSELPFQYENAHRRVWWRPFLLGFFLCNPSESKRVRRHPR